MKRRLTFSVLAPVCLLLIAAAASGRTDDGKPDNPHVWKPRTTSVTVFKNGLGFFLAEAEVELDKGWAIAPHVPPAAFGTFAIFSHDEGTTVDVVGSGPGQITQFDGHDAPDTADARRSRLEALMGLNVRLTHDYRDDPVAAVGKLVTVGPKFAILEGDAGNIAVELRAVSEVQVLDYPLRIHVAADDGPPPERVTLGMAWLQSGITWIPEYTLQVRGEDSADLTLRGTLVNEADDLIGAEINFVVGVPHFVHTDYRTPLAVGQAVETIRSVAAASAPPQVATQIANRAAIVSNIYRAPQFERGGTETQPVEARPGDLAAATGNLPQLGGAAGSDYTVYRKGTLTLRRGEKAIVTLFRRRVSYSHVYRWTAPQPMKHYLRLRNATDTAWTTGPCLVLDEKGPLSEDLLLYTPAGGNAEVPVSQAINIAHEFEQREVDRKLKAHNPSSNYYLDLVTLRGTVRLHNFEQRPVELFVTVPIAGQPIDASDGGTLHADADKLVLSEREGSITWRVTLDEDESREFSYTYERYVPSRK